MASYTTSLRLVQPATGEYSGSWGTQVNNGLTALVDTSVAGTASITMTAANYTLSSNNGATDEARAMFLVLGGTPGAARNVICPAVSKLYYVTNNTTGGFAQTVKTASGSGISVPNGASMVLRCDGTNVVEAQNSLGSIVLNGGTANGVAYLNASKALTTGSALVFDGTNLGIGTSSPGTSLQVGNGSGLRQIAISGGGYDLALGASGGSIFGFASQAISTVFNTASVPLGIGTNAAQPLVFGTGATERARIDTSGNLGLGVTPSAWTSTYKAFALGSVNSNLSGFWDGTTAITTLATGGAVIGGAWTYTMSGQAVTRYAQSGNGAHQWFTAPSGTAGNAISFTQALTLHASGGMSLGNTTDPGATNLSVTGTITSGKGANVASAATVTLGAGNFFDITGTTTISNITIKPAGTVVYLKFDSTINLQTGTIGNSGALRLAGAATLAATQYDVLTLISDGTNWWQTAFSAN